MDIYIVRHGLSEGNARMIFQGWIDYPLAEEGRRQAAHLGKFFNQQKISFDRIISSPLLRAKETTEIIQNEFGSTLEIEFEDSIKEINIGQLEGVHVSDAEEKFPTYYQRPPSGWLDFEEFGGESWKSLKSRVDSVMPKYIDENKLLEDASILIVSHGASMRAIVRSILKIDEGIMYIRIENCGHFKLSFVETRGHLRRYVEYFLPLTSVQVDGIPYNHKQSDHDRSKSVS